ncbi:MAG TPA: helix-turn-helix domain-containing protein [Gaiellaceae bacterium]|nr:helix-turn-helix domain-containing protein [Gaiellaceae bacterium]
MGPIAGEQRPMRRHARRNHERLVEAAREVFGERGVEAPLEAIARRAGVGIATLYRHFPTREALVEAIFERRIGELVAVADAALAEPDGWAAFTGLLERTLELQAGDRVLKEVFLRHPPPAGRIASVREGLRRRFEQILTRAQAQGALRADFTFADLALVLWSLRPVMDATATVAPDAWRRHLHLLLDGLRAPAATPHAQPPLTDDDLHAAMRALRESQRRR